ncbi:ATP-binding cassette domain-containing protein [Virgibacillus xinjiangensis]|uniref:ATP-binding cassette domain-containing protein n=1 Tax=Virgibacillus xinjiangensis TaxID=393090 RepID=A0ABV7CS86_9BACI
MALLTVSNLSKNYEGNPAVRQVSFSFHPGTCTALIGPNGAGKTTILRTLAGLLKPSKGEISFSGMEKNQDIREHIGYLPQYPSFHGWMTGKEFLVHAGRLARLTKKEAEQRADDLLHKVGIAEAKDKSISKYSGGMKQRLGIAQAIIHKPKLLMLDEPVSSLDPLGRREVLTLMEELKQEMAILFSTHILSDAEEVSDRLLLLKDGVLVEDGTMTELRQKYQTSRISMQIEGDMTGYLHELESIPEVKDCHAEKDSITIICEDVETARRNILLKAAQEDWPVTGFSINQVSLEEMFMKAVKT